MEKQEEKINEEFYKKYGHIDIDYDDDDDYYDNDDYEIENEFSSKWMEKNF